MLSVVSVKNLDVNFPGFVVCDVRADLGGHANYLTSKVCYVCTFPDCMSAPPFRNVCAPLHSAQHVDTDKFRTQQPGCVAQSGLRITQVCSQSCKFGPTLHALCCGSLSCCFPRLCIATEVNHTVAKCGE